jgi:CheY-like chemotaxis protein
MTREVLIIDDDQNQAQGLLKALKVSLPKYSFQCAFEEEAINDFIENKFYNLAIVDLRMDKFSFSGVDLIRKIIEINPFSKIVIISAFVAEYLTLIKPLLASGRIIDIIEKESFETWVPKMSKIVDDYYEQVEQNSSEINSALIQFYSDAKNQSDTYIKGRKLENFVSLLFGNFGFKEIRSRVVDKSLNEIDLIVRNEINDNFLNKFGKYILIECKNRPNKAVNKNDFILFAGKLENTNGLVELGIIVTSGYISWNTYIEAVRTSKGKFKIVFISNPEIERLINSIDKISTFKSIIDEQVKDN